MEASGEPSCAGHSRREGPPGPEHLGSLLPPPPGADASLLVVWVAFGPSFRGAV